MTARNTSWMMEDQKKEVEQDLRQAILKGQAFWASVNEDIKTLFELIIGRDKVWLKIVIIKENNL